MRHLPVDARYEVRLLLVRSIIEYSVGVEAMVAKLKVLCLDFIGKKWTLADDG